MAGIKNYIETVVRLNTAKAQKSVNDLFSKISSGSKKASANLKKTDKSIDKVGSSATVAGAKVKKGFGGIGGIFAGVKAAIMSTIPALNSFKIALMSTGVGVIVVALGSFIALMVSAARRGADFSKSLSTLEAVAGATEGELKKLSNQAKQLGSTTAFTASQVLELQTELAKLGFTVDQIGDATPSILDLAASLDVSLADAASFAGGTINAFGLETSETQRVVDVMAKTAVSSAQDFTTLRESFSKAAPAANALGLTIERTGALLGVLSDSSIKGSEAGTALKNSFIELKKKGLSLDDGLDKIAGSSDKLLTAIELAGKRGGPALLALVNKRGKIGELQEKLEGAAGAARKIAEIRLDNLAGDTTKLSSAWEGMLLSIEDGTGILNTMSRKTIQGLTSAIQTLPVVMDYLGFIWTDTWDIIKGYTQGAATWLSGSFITMTSTVQVFAAKAQLALSEIPIIGEGLDTDRITKDLDNASAALSIGLQKMQKAKEIFNKQGMLGITQLSRFSLEQAKKKEAQDKISAKKAKDAAKKAKAGTGEDPDLGNGGKEMAGLLEDGAKTIEKRRQKELDAQLTADRLEIEQLQITEEQKRTKLREIEDKYLQEDIALDQAKLDRRREKELLEIEDLKVTMQAKEDLKNQLNLNFDEKDKLLAQEKVDRERAQKTTWDQEDADLALEKRILDQEEQILRDEEELALARSRGEDTLQMEKDLIEQRRIFAVEQAGLTVDQIAKINQDAAAATKKLEAASFIATKKSVDERAKQGLNAAAEAFGISQELAVAQMLMAAPEAIAGSFKNAAKVYAPPLSLAMGAAGAAATVIPIIKGLADIKKARFPGAKRPSGGSISAGGGGGGGGMPAGISPNLISNLSSNNSARLGNDQGISNGASSMAANNVAAGSSANVTFSESSYQEFRRQVQFKEDKTQL